MGIALSHCQYLFRDYYDQGEVLVLDGAQLRCELSSWYAMNQDVEGLLDESGTLAVRQGSDPAMRVVEALGIEWPEPPLLKRRKDDGLHVYTVSDHICAAG